MRKTGPVGIEVHNSVTFDARSPAMTHWMPAKVLQLSGTAFCRAPPIGGLLVHDNFRPDGGSVVIPVHLVWMYALVKVYGIVS